MQWVPDYEKILKRGFLDIRKEAQDKLAALDLTNSLDIWEKKPFLEAMIIVCDAIMIWSKRHVRLARETAASESAPKRREELLRMAEICDHAPAHPARDFREAMQCQWFVQMFSRIEQKANAIISNGRMDQYLYPYPEISGASPKNVLLCRPVPREWKRAEFRHPPPGKRDRFARHAPFPLPIPAWIPCLIFFSACP